MPEVRLFLEASYGRNKKMGINNEMGICVYCGKEVYSRVGTRIIRNAICEDCIKKLEERGIRYD
ncbi:MAG: hypothetical protein KAR20_17190 [Candidatus Heimdallarchaeota archaeon]|nr:hypothetical protein [Candidatus Heimdallarchaeota archaeon]